MMEIENLFRYTAPAVGLKPSAMQGKARLRGLYRIISSKTIISVIAWGATLGMFNPVQLGSNFARNAIIRYAPLAVGLMTIERLFRSTAPAVGLMEIENLIRYPA